jgi:hypothetical protein
MTIKVSRYGVSTGLGHPQDVGEAGAGVEYGMAAMFFSEPRGNGRSCYTLHIDPTSFEDVVQVMIRANAEQTIKAFAAALKDGVPAPKKEWFPWMDKKLGRRSEVKFRIYE